MVVLADELVFAVALGHRDARVGNIAEITVDGVDGVEGSQVPFGHLCGPSIGEGPPDDGLFLGDGRVYLKTSEIDGHVDGGRAIAMEVVERSEDSIELIATPDVIMIVPKIRAAREDVHLEACNDTKVVARTFHAPEQVSMAGFVDSNGSAIGQYNIELAEVVANHAVYTFKGSVATPQAGTQHADAIASTSGGNISPIPQVCSGLAVVDTSSKPGRLTIGLDSDVPESCHIDLDAVERSKTSSAAVATVYSQELDAVFIAVLDLEMLSARSLGW